MAEPFVGEIKFFSFDFPPRNWMLCDGRELPISQHQTLYALLGTTFGGNGTVTFALPDLRGRVPRHPGSSTPQGAKEGVESVALTPAQMPSHNHTVAASSSVGTQEGFENALFAASSDEQAPLYAALSSAQALNASVISNTGGSQAHSNCQPSLVGNYCIAIKGIFPSQS